jgi:hypothetical protein
MKASASSCHVGNAADKGFSALACESFLQAKLSDVPARGATRQPPYGLVFGPRSPDATAEIVGKKVPYVRTRFSVGLFGLWARKRREGRFR